MTTTTGNAVRMQMDLNALIKARGVEKLAPKFLPLLDPVDHDVEVSGLASTTDVDLSHQKFRGWALCSHAIMLRHEVPPLLYKHDPKQVAGTIESLKFDDTAISGSPPRSRILSQNAAPRSRSGAATSRKVIVKRARLTE